MRLFGNFESGQGAVGLLFLRLVAGVGLVLHGLPKIQNPTGWMRGGDVPGWLQALAALSEFGGGLAIIVGLLTPLACFGVMSTMFVAVLSHLKRSTPEAPQYFVKPAGAPPEAGSYELAVFYFVIALTLFLTGPGLLSLDAKLFGKGRGSRK